MELSGMAADSLMSPPFRSAYRALGLVLVSGFVASSLPSWIRMSLHISPILAMMLVICVIYIQGQFWRKYSSDVSVTFFRIVFNSAFYVNRLRRELNPGNASSNNNNENTLADRQKSAGSFLRVIVFFTMVQHCLTSYSLMVWLPLHLFLAYRFLADYIKLVHSKIHWRLRHNVQNTNTEPSDQTTTEPSTGEQQQSYKTLAMQLGCHALKLLYIYGTLHFGVLQISVPFLLVTGVYFILARHYVEEALIKLVESLQLEVFEGLEQYYVSGFLGVVEILLALSFMVWSLVIRRHMLMFLALYTNIYQRGQEIVSSTLNVALVEWTQLSQLERATKSELSDYDDVCAVCLCPMRSARKTPCGHFFHGHCLRRCLKVRHSCPLCNAGIDW